MGDADGIGVIESVSRACEDAGGRRASVDSVGAADAAGIVSVKLLSTVNGSPHVTVDCWVERPMRERRVVRRSVDLRILVGEVDEVIGSTLVWRPL